MKNNLVRYFLLQGTAGILSAVCLSSFAGAGRQETVIGDRPGQYAPMDIAQVRSVLAKSQLTGLSAADILSDSAKVHATHVQSSESAIVSKPILLKKSSRNDAAKDGVTQSTSCPIGYMPYDGSLGDEWMTLPSHPGYPIPNTTYCFRSDYNASTKATVYSEVLWDNSVPNGQPTILYYKYGPAHGEMIQYMNYDDGRRQIAKNFWASSAADLSVIETSELQVGDTLTFNGIAPGTDGKPDTSGKSGYQLQFWEPIQPAAVPAK